MNTGPAVDLSSSQLLRTKIAIFGQRLETSAYRFWTHPQFAVVYREYLCRSHSIIRASVPLMRTARECCLEARFASDPVLRGFGDYLEKHVQEETGHDAWILDDAAAMGVDSSLLLETIPDETARRMVGSQYYWMHHYNPIALLGYIAVMEGNPPETAFIEDVARRNNLPLEAFSSFLLHAKVDPRHKQDLDELVDSLPLSEHHMSLIGISAIETIGCLTEVLDAINQSHVL